MKSGLKFVLSVCRLTFKCQHLVNSDAEHFGISHRCWRASINIDVQDMNNVTVDFSGDVFSITLRDALRHSAAL